MFAKDFTICRIPPEKNDLPSGGVDVTDFVCVSHIWNHEILDVESVRSIRHRIMPLYPGFDPRVVIEISLIFRPQVLKHRDDERGLLVPYKPVIEKCVIEFYTGFITEIFPFQM